MATTGIVTTATVAAADPDPAGLSVTKTGPAAEDMPLAPGDTFNYTIQVTCDIANCYDASVSDVVPPPLELAGTPTVVASDPYVIDTSSSTGGADDSFEVDFTYAFDNIVDPGQGMRAGTTATITVPVRVPTDADYDYSGQELVNTATASASNADDQTSSWPITIDVTPTMDTDVSKSFDPDTGVASEGELTTATITASNASDTAADGLTITDPAPGAASNPFDYLDLEALRITSIPDGTDQIVVTVQTSSGPQEQVIPVTPGTTVPVTVDLSGIDPADVTGISVAFEDDGTEPLIAEGATGGVEVDFSQEDPGELTDDTVVTNEASSEVSRDDFTGEESASDDYTITTNIPEVSADKTFDDDFVLHGDSSTATITAGVDGTVPVESITVTEPSNGAFSPDGMSFEGFPGPIVFPEGATSAEITYETSSGTVGPVALTDGATPTLPPGLDPADVTGFSITFSAPDGSTMPAPGGPASIPVEIGTPDLDGTEEVTYTNEVTTTGTTEEGVNGEATAEDDLHAFDEHIDGTAEKNIVPGTITGNPGEWIVVQLSGGIADNPVDGNTDDPYSTTGADSITVQDPADPTAPGGVWDAFNPTAIRDVNVPADTELQINYWDGSAWVPLDLSPDYSNPVQGAADVSVVIDGSPSPDEIGGLQFVYTPTDEDATFPPGTEFKPNVVMEVDEDWADSDPWATGGDPLTLENCASGTGAADIEGTPVAPDAPAEGCDTVDVEDPNSGGGPGPTIAKNIPDETIPARSHETTHANLRWSTGGQSNVDSASIVDQSGVPAADTNAPFDATGTFFDAFDLTKISVNDPLLQYDAIDAVQIFNGDIGQWVAPTNSQCDAVVDDAAVAACQGAMPDITLTDDEQATTVAVRIVVIENPDEDARATVEGEIVPPVGSGVARSVPADDRIVRLDLRIRDWLRSNDSEPVDLDSATNPATITTQSSVNGPGTDSDNDPIAISPVDLDATTTKTWDGSPVGIPPEATDPSLFPHTGVALTVTNNTEIVYVDQLQIVDRPTVDRPEPDPQLRQSDVFNYTSIDQIVVPAGADGFTLELFDSADAGAAPALTATTHAEYLAFTEAQLEPMVGLVVTFHGRDEAALGAGEPTTGGIEPGATGGIDYLMQLRQTDRTDGTQINTDAAIGDYVGQDVLNTAEGSVTDAASPDVATDPTDATVILDQFEIGVGVEKGFTASAPASRDTWSDPYSQVETTPETQDEFVMWMAVTPTEGARPVSMDISDLDPTFWNAYEFVGIDPSFTLTDPIDQVEMWVCLNSEQPLAVSGTDISGGCAREVDPVTNEASYTGLAAISSIGTREPEVDPALPAAYDAEDVNGLVFTFSSEEAWDNPWNPEQDIPIIVKRRTERLTGGAPETDYVENSPAPGELQAGWTENTIEGSITAALGEEGTSDEQLHNSQASDHAVVIYEHAVTAVEVEKEPGGEAGASPLSPGAVVPFTLTFTNIGDAPIYNPVFSDVLPDVDGDGEPDLQVDPNLIQQGISPYTYDLDDSTAQPLPAGWTAPGVTDAEVTTSPDPATGAMRIDFSFEDMTALAAGASYTITIQMVPQPGFAPNVNFVNTAVVDGDRQFDYCTVDDDDPAAYEDTCEGEATNSVAEGGAIRTGKFVHAGEFRNPDYSRGAFISNAPDMECETTDVVTGLGYYASPCTPRSVAGQIETWRLPIQNTGNIPLESVVAVDRLPAIGDTTVLPPNSARDSEFTVELVDPIANFFFDIDVVADITAYVTTDDNLCLDVLNDTGDCGDFWTEWDAYIDAGGASEDVVAVMYVGNFNEGSELAPGDTAWVDMETRTPAIVPERPDQIAYNSIATSATTTTGTHISATEGLKVGVALTEGSITIAKETDGDGADLYGLDEYDLTLICTVDVDGEAVEVVNETYTVDANATEPTVIDNLPTDATCTLEEADYGQVSSTLDPSEVTVPWDGDPEPVEVGLTMTNTYELASLEVSKFVIGDGESIADPDAVGPFEIGILCTFRGEYVTASNTDDWTPYVDGSPVMVVELFNDESVILEDLPTGATCYAGEYPGHGADRVGIFWETGDASGDVIADEDGSLIFTDEPLTLTSNTEDEVPQPTNFVDVYNQFASGVLEITKELSGPGAEDHAGETFMVDVLCTFTDPQAPDVVVTTFDDTVEVVPGQTTVIDSIVGGSECTLTEPEDGRGDADQWSFDPSVPNDPTTGIVIVEEAGDQQPPAAITVDNRFEVPTDLVVTKEVAGPVLNAEGDVPDIGPFTVEVMCVYAEGTPYEREVFAAEFASNEPGTPMVIELSHDESVTLTGLPTGTVCDVTETDAAGASFTTFSAHSAGQPAPDPEVGTNAVVDLAESGLFSTNEVDFVNSYPVGNLVIDKLVTGDGAEARGAGPFTVHVSCVSDDFGVVSYDDDITLGGDEPLSATVTGILAPSTCEVTEIDNGGADAAFFTPGTPEEKSSTVAVVPGADVPVQVTIENVFEAFASLDVTKVVDPTVATADGTVPDFGSYLVWVRCTYDEGGPDEHRVYAEGHGPLRPMVVSLSDGETATFTGIPATSTCSVTEVDAGGAASTTVTTETADAPEATADGTAGTVVLTADAPETTNHVTFTNAYEPGSLEIVKEVLGEGAADATGPFEFSVVCTWSDGDSEPVVTWDGTVTVSEETGLTASIDGIVADSECVVTETDAGGADDTRLTPAGDADDEARVVIAAGSTVTVNAYNQFNGGGVLPITGFEGQWMLIVALLLLGLGVAVVVTARRRNTP